MEITVGIIPPSQSSARKVSADVLLRTKAEFSQRRKFFINWKNYFNAITRICKWNLLGIQRLQVIDIGVRIVLILSQNWLKLNINYWSCHCGLSRRGRRLCPHCARCLVGNHFVAYNTTSSARTGDNFRIKSLHMTTFFCRLLKRLQNWK